MVSNIHCPIGVSIAMQSKRSIFVKMDVIDLCWCQTWFRYKRWKQGESCGSCEVMHPWWKAEPTWVCTEYSTVGNGVTVNDVPEHVDTEAVQPVQTSRETRSTVHTVCREMR